ncbi:CS domain protein [Toxoplasma gondii MAS]|uniref:CS domain protein n=2 Tax=Toxoplasma gondii TaxID=5811 RepID=A0A086Q2Z6_TOXGO|nr:CS domain protein [Toxoplasma gondii MAS]PUA85956.1 CS domain protein [Toxoplasma gondii TgCATBr9]
MCGLCLLPAALNGRAHCSSLLLSFLLSFLLLHFATVSLRASSLSFPPSSLSPQASPFRSSSALSSPHPPLSWSSSSAFSAVSVDRLSASPSTPSSLSSQPGSSSYASHSAREGCRRASSFLRLPPLFPYLPRLGRAASSPDRPLFVASILPGSEGVLYAPQLLQSSLISPSSSSQSSSASACLHSSLFSSSPPASDCAPSLFSSSSSPASSSFCPSPSLFFLPLLHSPRLRAPASWLSVVAPRAAASHEIALSSFFPSPFSLSPPSLQLQFPSFSFPLSSPSSSVSRLASSPSSLSDDCRVPSSPSRTPFSPPPLSVSSRSCSSSPPRSSPPSRSSLFFPAPGSRASRVLSGTRGLWRRGPRGDQPESREKVRSTGTPKQRPRRSTGLGSLCMRGWGRNADYGWEEEDEGLKVFVAVEAEATSRDVDCVIGPKELFLKLRHRNLPLIDGTLKGRVSVENSYWCIEDITARNRLPQCLSASSFSPASPTPPSPSSSCSSSGSPPPPSSRVPSDAEIAKAPWLGLDLVENGSAPPPAEKPLGKLLTVYLQKKRQQGTGRASGGVAGALAFPEWGGVLEGEAVEDLFYDILPSKMRDVTPAHRAQDWVPGALLYRQPFPASFTRQEALQFVDAWTRSQSAIGADAIVAGPAMSRATSTQSSSLLSKAQALLAPHSDPAGSFGLPATQMFIIASPLPDGVRLSFEGPSAPRESPSSSSCEEAGGAMGGHACRERRRKEGSSASAPDARSASFGDSLSLATANQFLQRGGSSRDARYDEAGQWLPEDSLEIRVIGEEGSAAGEEQEDGFCGRETMQERLKKQTFTLELVVLRGPVGSGGKGEFGPLVSLQVRDTEERLLKKLQQDLLGVTLAMRERLQARARERKEMEDDLLGPPKDLRHHTLAREFNREGDDTTSLSSPVSLGSSSPSPSSSQSSPPRSLSSPASPSSSSAASSTASVSASSASLPADAVEVDTEEITPEWIEKFPGLQASVAEERQWLSQFPLKTRDGKHLVPPLEAEPKGPEDEAGREARQKRNEKQKQRERERQQRKEDGRNPYGIKVVDLDGQSGQKPPDFMSNWSLERRREFQREVVHDLEQNIRRCHQTKEVLSMADVTRHLQTFLNFSDEEIADIWRTGHAEASRFINDPGRDIENLKKNQEKRKTHWAQHDLFFPLEREAESSEESVEKIQVFDLMAGPGPDVASPHTLGFKVLQTEYDRPLHRRWDEMPEREQLEYRVKLREKEARLDMLLCELMEVTDESMFPVICDQYKDLLMDEHFLLIMKLRIQERPPRSRREKDIFVIVNKFTVSLYEDVESLALQNEKEQLKKIRLLCMQALVDIDKLTEYAESMKHLLNRDFLAYLEFAIHAERKRIQKEGNNPDAAPSQWLMVLMIIHKGVMSIYEKEIWEDVMWITMVVTQKQPEVRRKLLELFVAQIPKADWKQFKRVALRMASALAQGGGVHGPLSFPSCPWVPAAVQQLARDLERILPDWMIEGMMTDFDKQVLKQKMDRMSCLWGEKDLEDLRHVNVTLPNVSELMKQQIEQATEVFNRPENLHQFSRSHFEVGAS